MGAKILTTSEAVATIEARLLDGWVILDAPMDVLIAIEKNIYTPGTPRNADFEILGFMPSIHLGRKTDELKALLQDPQEWETLLFVGFSQPEGRQVTVCFQAYDPAILTAEKASAQMAAKAGESLEGRR